MSVCDNGIGVPRDSGFLAGKGPKAHFLSELESLGST